MKRFLGLLGVLLLALALVACKKPTPTPDPDPDPDPQDELVITFTGVEAATITAGDPFNVLTGVKATGNDNKDYTDKIKVATPNAKIAADGTLNTETAMNAVVKYSITLIEPEYYVELLRTITIKAPERPEGEMIANPNFAEGMLYWDTYNGAGAATFTPDGENGMKIEITAVGDKWEPRITQMGVPFNNDQAYKISFEAKALEPKTVNLQVGEILSGAPYFVDFKTALVTRVIGTEWATYEYEFYMSQPEENHRGGVLFEFGTIDGDDTCTTVWLRNVQATPVTLSPDVDPPTITTRNLTLQTGTAFTPDMLIVSISDEREGSIPVENATYVIRKDGEVVETIDNTVEGVYEIEFTVADKSGNKATATATVTFKNMTFKATNLVVNPEFTANLDNWEHWLADWDGTAATITHEVVETNGMVKVDVTNTGSEIWSVQVFQEDIPIVMGKTYQLSFRLKASVARTFGVEVADGVSGYKILPTEVANATTEWQEYSYVFTTHATPESGKVIFMFGLGDPAVFELDDVKILEAELPEYMVNTNFDPTYGWRFFTNSWEGTVGNLDVVNNEFVLTLTQRAGNTESWTLQFIQDLQAFTKLDADDNKPLITLEAGKTYVYSFAVQGDDVFDIKALITKGEIAGWANLIADADATIGVTAEKVTHNIEFTVPADHEGLVMVKFEFGTAIPAFTELDPARVLKFSNFTLKEKDNSDAEELIYNGDGKAIKGFVFEHASGDVHGSMIINPDRHLEITTTSMGGEAYVPHVYQGDISLDAGDYVFRMTIKSSVARTLRINFTVPEEGYRSLLPAPDYKYDIVIGDDQEDQYVEVEVRFTVAGPVSGVKFELDLGLCDEGDLPGVFTIKRILLYREFN